MGDMCPVIVISRRGRAEVTLGRGRTQIVHASNYVHITSRNALLTFKAMKYFYATHQKFVCNSN